MKNETRRDETDFLLEGNLRPGEKVVWQSKPERFALMSGINGKQILMKWLRSAIIMLAIIGVYAVATGGAVKMKLIVLLLIILALLMLSPVMEWFNILGQYYILTNQRAVLVRGDRKLFTMDIRNIDDAQIVQLSPNENCLLLGSRAVASEKKQLRWLAAHPIEASEEGEAAKGLVFYAARDVEQALRLVSQGADA